MKSILIFAITCCIGVQSFSQKTPEEIKAVLDSMKGLEGQAQQLIKQLNDMKNGPNPFQNLATLPSKSASPKKNIGEQTKINLPSKNIRLLALIKPFNGQQLVAFYKKSAQGFYSNFKKPKEKQQLDSVFAHSSANALNSIARVHFLNRRYDAAILCMLKILEKDSSNVRAASNLGTFCVSAGVPEKAIPVLEYYLKSSPSNPSLLNNCGQAYLALGDIAKAEQYLKQAVSNAAWHPDANAALAWINASKGNKNQAISYAKKSLESAYNATAIEVMIEMLPDEEELYKTLPEPSFDLYPATKDVIELPQIEVPSDCVNIGIYVDAQIEPRKAFGDMFEKLNKSLTGKVGEGNINQLMSFANGAMTNALKNKSIARSQKAKLLMKKAEKQYLKKIEEYQLAFNDFLMRETPKVGKEIDKARESCLPALDFQICFCRKKQSIINAFLAKYKAQYNIYRSSYWKATRDYALVMEYWEPVAAAGNPMWSGDLQGYARKSLLLNNAKLLVGNDLTSYDCCDPSKLTPSSVTNADFSNTCNGFNLTIPFVIGELNLTCEKVKIKGGEGLVVGYEYEFKSGQSTLMAGPGFNLHEGMVNVDAAAMVYVTSDSDGNFTDVGVKGTAEASFMKVGPVTYLGAEVELSVGWEAGPSSEITGKVFNQEAIKWK